MEETTHVTTNTRFPKEVHAQPVALAADQRRSINPTEVAAVERYIRQMRARRAREGGNDHRS